MKVTIRGHKIYVDKHSKNEYPRLSILLAVALLYMAPFVTMWLAVPSFVICLYRVFRYDAKVFATDYCILLPLTSLTKVPGLPALFVYLCLIAGIWYFLKGGLRTSMSFVLLILLMNYLVIRMQMNITGFVLCFGQLFVLCVLLPKQDGVSVERTVKAFLFSLILSSAYAFILRKTGPIRSITGADAYAIWGLDIKRFKGLFKDPNYYMTLLIIGLALLLKLRDGRMVGTGKFLFQGAAMVAFGVLTYSKTFFLVLMLLGATYIVWRFRSKKIISGLALTVIALVLLNVLIFTEGSPFAVVIERLLSARNLNDLTTGRTELYLDYWGAITEDLQSFFLGKGLAAEGLRKDPHNIYLEIMYYVGLVGFILITGIFFALVHESKWRSAHAREQHFIARYVVLFMFLLLFFTLHGMFQIVSYGELFLTMMSLMITGKQDELPGQVSAEGKEMRL